MMGLSLRLTVHVTSYFKLGVNLYYKDRMVKVKANSIRPSAHTKVEKEEIEEVYKEAFPIASERFRSVCDEIRNILGDRIL